MNLSPTERGDDSLERDSFPTPRATAGRVRPVQPVARHVHRCTECGQPCCTMMMNVQLSGDPWHFGERCRSACCEAEYEELD